MHIQHVHIHVGGLSSAALTAAALASLMSFDAPAPGASIDKAPARATTAPPRINEYWKGEGGIYVGIGRGYDAPDHHLILATDPKAVFTKRMLGTYGVDVTGATSDDDGLPNTLALAEAGSELCKEILALEIDGRSDFYLMSRTDARLCMANVADQFEKEWYLTSTQYSSDDAWYQDFGNGTQYYSSKKFEARARAVRRLIL